jgi:valyl-tRNA synthetase
MTTAKQLSKAYDPAEVEGRWYRYWLEQGYFHAEAQTPKTPYSIVIPPPNVTGSLHMGHALGDTIQDILVRWKRMQGYNAMWLPGTDHAGIATQTVVERALLRDEKKTRHDLGREEFLRRVWAWKEKNGGRIVEQMKALGLSLDWTRERFTMDEGLSKAVREAFVTLHEEGLIYRARRLINWCPRCQTALSDLEVEHKEQEGSLWHIAYPVDGTNERLTVATTRPETLLGDTAVAVHPEDERYKHLIGKKARLPLTDRLIPIVGDDILVSREFGTGAVKVTPGHDFNDFECGQRHGLEQLSILDLTAHICPPAPARYVGMTTEDARKAVVADLEAEGLLVKTEPHTLSIGRCQRCDTVAEPTLSMQWFVKVAPLAAPAIEAVEKGKTKFVPEAWTKTYMHWMTNIKDWCISRQLWWGHRIPAWHCGKCGEITVARTAPTQCKCGAAELTQDNDVLDTWFSSALWPFSTLGWPEPTRDLKTFYPTSVLETGFDIIFFWVARMMMMGLHFMKKPPFRTVFIHAMVVDEHGEKMSKTRGNVIDPLDVVNGATVDQLADKAKAGGAPEPALKQLRKTFPEGIPAAGADALRFTLAAMAAQGRNIRLALGRVEGYRHFANKIWNASRFALMNLGGFDPDGAVDFLRDGPTAAGEPFLPLPERWILSRLTHTITEVDEALSAFRINDAAQALYRFIWSELCDWYIELAKPSLYDGADAMARKTAQTALFVSLESALRLLHPFMPYLTEEIWQQLPKPTGTPASLMITLYPIADRRLLDEEAEREVALLQETVTAVRNLMGEYAVPSSSKATLILQTHDAAKRALLEKIIPSLRSLVRQIDKVELRAEGAAPSASGSAVLGDVEMYLPLAGIVDLGAERARLEKERGKAGKDVELLERKLSNDTFVARAPAEVVEKDRARLADLRASIAKLTAALERISQL